MSTEIEREADETHALLEHMALQMVTGISAEQHEWLREYQEEYERDVAGYSFDAELHSGFLFISITRGANKEGEIPYALFDRAPFPRKATEAFCIVGCDLPKVVPGHLPDLNGEIGFFYRLQYPEGGCCIGSTGFGNYAARDGQRWIVPRPEKFLPHGRPLFYRNVTRETSKYAGFIPSIPDLSYQIKTKVSGAARLAQDDQICFSDIGRTIFAPAGRGQVVLESIFSAMGHQCAATTSSAHS